jgi:hypothetical protein
MRIFLSTWLIVLHKRDEYIADDSKHEKQREDIKKRLQLDESIVTNK